MININMARKMEKLIIFPLLLLILVSQLADSRSIKTDVNMISNGGGVESKPHSLERGLSGVKETCEPVYGFLPCSTNVWGLLFLTVVYEILLTFGGKYVAKGSELFFKTTGPTVFGASLFQFLGTIPQTVLVLSTSLSGTVEAAQEKVKFGMGLVAGTTVMLLTLIWGISVILGSYDLSEAITIDKFGSHKHRPKGYGVITDAETSYTARIMLMTLIPFLILLLANFFKSSSTRRVIILIALIATVFLLFGYMFYETFQPWIQHRRFENLMTKYAKDKLLQLLSTNGNPDTQKIQELFCKIDKNKNASVSKSELRVLFLGLKMDDDDDLSTERDVEIILESFDTSGDGNISQDEFFKGMNKIVSNLSDQTPNRLKKSRRSSNSKKNSQLEKGLLGDNNTGFIRKASSNLWSDYLKAFFLVIVGTVMLVALATPLSKSVQGFANAADFSSLLVSYFVVPLATNYRVAVQSIASARQKTQKSISLTLSALYGGVYMNNIVGMMVFLAPVYARNLTADVSAEVAVVVLICFLMTLFTSFCTKFPRSMGYLVLLLYPISLSLVYLLTSVLGWA